MCPFCLISQRLVEDFLIAVIEVEIPEDTQRTIAPSLQHHDQDSAYTSYDWSGRILRVEELRGSYALSRAKDNLYIEVFSFASGRKVILTPLPLCGE